MKHIILFVLAIIVILPVNASKLSPEQAIELTNAFRYKVDTTGVSCEALLKRGIKDYQIKNMYISFQYGKSQNMAYPLAAIAFKESSAGNPKFMSNPRDPSAGYHGVLLTNVIKLLDMKDTPNNRAIVEDMLINSHGASAYFAMDILGWWLKQHNGDWFKAYRSYNGGYYWKPRGNHQLLLKRTWKYASDIQTTIKDLQTCGWD